jgi:uncharacterized flavoprotein (TIGR03862 family)
VGGGPAALMLAATLDSSIFDITIYERNYALGRKFLVAGDGGFNITHSEDIESFVARYTPPSFLEASIRAFPNTQLRTWLKEIGIDTFVGSSKRVFPTEGTKPIEVLNAILTVLKAKNVQIKTQHLWQGWSESNGLLFRHLESELEVQADVVVFALGGASWGKTGSDGTWASLLENKGISIVPFQPSNCAFEIRWEKSFLASAEGKSLKNIAISCDGSEKKGEVVITRFGLEGGAIYALSPQIRKRLAETGTATILIDLKPSFTLSEIKDKLSGHANKSPTKILKEQLHLSDVQLALLKSVSSKEEYLDIELLASKIKQLPLQVVGVPPIDEAISTVGGIALHEVDSQFQLLKLPHHYAIGEMLDWDAPTGGYLLQACFSMGFSLAKHLNADNSKTGMKP